MITQSKSNPRTNEREQLLSSIMHFCGVDDEHNRNTFKKLLGSLSYEESYMAFYEFVPKAESQHIANRAAYFTKSLKNLIKDKECSRYDDFDAFVFGTTKKHDFSSNIAYFGVIMYLYELSCEYKGFARLLALTTAIETLIYGVPISIKTRDNEGNDILAASHRLLMKRIYKTAKPFADEYRPYGRSLEELNRMPGLYFTLVPEINWGADNGQN